MVKSRYIMLRFNFFALCLTLLTSVKCVHDYEAPSEYDYESDECLCVPFYQCEDREVVHFIQPIKRQTEEELPLDENYEPQRCGQFHVCCRNPETSTVKPYEHRCGMRNPGGINGKILSANASGEAEFGEWPWQAAVLKKDGAEFIFKCGGTLIDEKHIITVAHCVKPFIDDKESLVVRLGEWDTQNTDEFLEHEDYGVEDIIVHSRYRPSNLVNDIAIVVLNKEVKFKPHIDTACLPREDDDFTGQECIVTGWGTNAYKSGSSSVIMKEAAVPVIGHAECQNKLRKTRLGKYFRLHRSFLCAGGQEGQDSCKGDVGGPLVCFRSDNYYTVSYTVAGLVAWGIDCGQPNVPGVYVNVKNFTNWITSKTGKDIESYWNDHNYK